MLDDATLIRKVRFPRQLVPLSVVATQLVTFAVMLAVLIVLCLVVILPETRDTVWLALPLARAAVALVGGLALAVASANVVFRDVEHLVAALLLPWFFLTPILYAFDADPPAHDRTSGSSTSCTGGTRSRRRSSALRDPLFLGGRRPGRRRSTSASPRSSLALGAYGLQAGRRPDRGRALTQSASRRRAPVRRRAQARARPACVPAARARSSERGAEQRRRRSRAGGEARAAQRGERLAAGRRSSRPPARSTAPPTAT